MAGIDVWDLASTSDAGIDEPLTAADVLKKLETAWMNETFSPDILDHQTDVIDCLFEQISEMEKNLARLNKNDLKVSIHRLEIDRIRYLISSYLKTRLTKIESFCATILDHEKFLINNEKSPRLSVEEMQFAKSYFAVTDGHLKKIALSHMPPNMQTMNNVQTMPKPNLDSYVFLKVNRTVLGVPMTDGDNGDRDELIDLKEGSQHLLPFSCIVHLLKNGSVSLI